MRCLAINRSYIPTRFISKYDAIIKLFAGRAEAICIRNGVLSAYDFDSWCYKSMHEKWPEDTEFVCSQYVSIAVPAVIRYLKYDRVPKVGLRFCRSNVFKRDGYRCYLCGEVLEKHKLTIDHVVPLSRGGKNEWSNVATCCKKCNGDKDDLLLSEFKRKPKFMPLIPRLSNIAKIKADKTEDKPEWDYFGV
jgi:5-methylcytosine-specific restriction endonuclease McrA